MLFFCIECVADEGVLFCANEYVYLHNYIKLWYTVLILCVLRICLILLRAHSPPDILDLQLSICSCQFRFSSISSPKNLTHLTRLLIILSNSNACVSDLTFLFF